MEALERISKQEMSPFETIDVDAFLTYGNIHFLAIAQSAFYGEIFNERSRLRIKTSFGVLFG